MTANHYTRYFSGLVTGAMLLFASALAADEALSKPQPRGPQKPQASLAFSNVDPAVAAVLSAEGIVGGEQIGRNGRVLGSLVVDGPMAANYPNDGDARATLMLDHGKDAYRFVGSSECAGLLEVRWTEPILEGQIRAFARGEGGRYLTQAVATIAEPTTLENLAVRGGANYRVQILWSQGTDDSGNAATFSRTIETAVGCDQVVPVSVGAPRRDLDRGGVPDLYVGIPAELPGRAGSASLLDAEDSSIKEFDNVGEDGSTSSCQTDDFNDNDLAGWTFANVGDSNQGGAVAAGGSLLLTSDGTTFYHDGDNGGFVYQNIGGDFRAQVKITGFPVDAGGGYRKSGITIRTGTGPNDPRVYAEFLPLHPFYNQTAIMFDYRDGSGNEFELASTPLNIPLPAHLAVERRGNKFTVYYSTNGVTWLKPAGAAGGSVTLPMPGVVSVGMMQASYDANVTMTSQFDDFKVCRPNVIPLPPFPPHGVCAPGVPIDIVYLLDSTGSMTVPFDDGVTKLDAARNAMVELNDLIESSVPGSRAALITFRGGFTPAFNQSSAVTVLSGLTTDFDAVEAAAASIDVNAIHPDATTPISIALDRTLTELENTSFLSTPIVIFIGDGWANIDFAGNGPLEYLRPEMGAISIIQSGNFIPWGSAAWLGNWNGAINTYDGEPLANAMYQTLRLKSTIPELVMFTVGVNSGDYRADLLSFMALYTGGDFYQVESATEMVEVLEGIYNGVDCGAEIGDTVWNDLDGNGAQNGGEPGIAGVTVELVDDNGDVVDTEITDSNGNYLFTGVFPGTYTVRVVTSTLPDGIDVQTYDFDGLGTPNEATVTVVDDESFLDADFGYKAGSSSIGDRVWDDLDGDTVQDVGEPGIAGVTVELVDSNNVVVATDVTDANGNYLFEDVPSGDYTVRVVSSTLPPNYGPTYDRDGIGTPHTAAVTVCCDQSVLDVDFGYRQQNAAKIGDRVWKDLDGDGFQDGGEPGLSGVTVELVNSSNVVIATDVTDANGNYLFENLAAGTYTVRVVPAGLPAGATATYDRDGIGTPHTAVVVLAANQVVLDADFGYKICLGSIGDKVWDDKDGDGTLDSGETGLPGVTLELVNSGGTVIATTTTNSSGVYTFNNVAPGTYTVRIVTSTLPAGSVQTYDKDGLATPHQSAVTVSCNQKVTNIDFGYKFCGGYIGDRVWDDKDGDGVQDSGETGYAGVTVQLVNSGGTVIATDVTDSNGKYEFENVAPGTYTVKIVTSTLPPGAIQTYDKDGLGTPHQATVTITCNQKVTNIDFGYRECFGSIGDRVWKDTDGDGVQDSGEVGYAGVTVQLVNSGGTVVATDVTDSNGKYEFENVAPGTWTVKVVTSTLPAGAVQTYDKDGLATPNQATFTLTCNQKKVDIDFGYRVCAGSIGDKVWDDKNKNGVVNSGEPGLANVTVELLNSSNAVIATTVTNASGNYLFSNLAAGTYTVRIVTSTLPPGAAPTYDKDGTGTPNKATVTLTCNQSRTDVDFGYDFPDPAKIAGHVIDDKNGDGKWDSGEIGIQGVTVQLVNSSGTVIATDVTDSRGYYSFENIPAGSYTVKIVTSTLPPNMEWTFDYDDGTHHEASVTVGAGQAILNVDFGYVEPKPSAIGDKVWKDLNGDGKFDSGEGEVGIANVTVQLIDPSTGTVIATDVTSSGGGYSFEDIPGNRTYLVRVVSSTLPADMIATWDWDGTQSPHEALVTLGDGEENWDVDFGYQPENSNGAWCPRTPGFWKNHPEMWPVSSLTFGGVTYNVSQLMTFLNYGGSDASTRLAHHLTATMLNLAMGSPAGPIQSTVNSASTFLVTWPPGSNPSGTPRTTANNLKNALDKYNNDPGCH